MFLLLHGPDEFSAAEELARLRASEAFGQNVEVFAGESADEATVEAIRAACETLPFLSTQRLIVVLGLPKRPRASAGEADDGQEPAAPRPRGKKGKAAGMDPRSFSQALAAIAPRMAPTTVLAIHVAEALEAAHPLVAAAKAYGQARAFPQPRGAQLNEWIQRRAADLGARLSPAAVRLLVEFVGEDLRTLAGEIQKLRAYAGSGSEIGPEAVRALTPQARQQRVFDLTDALARRERDAALGVLHELLAAGESPLGIVAMVAYQTRTLLQVQALSARGLRAAQIAQTAGIAPFVVEKSLPLARQFSRARLESAHRALLGIDAALKSSRATPEMALDLFVLEFTAPEASGRRSS